MTSCWLPLVAVFALVASSPVPRAPAGSATAAPSSPLDLLNDHNRSLAPDMADPRPVKNHNRMWAGERARALDQYSLPTNVAPVLYNIELTPSFDDFTFYGSSLIIINCYETTKDLVLHSKELAVEDYIYVRDDRTGYLYTSAVGIELDPVHDTLKISFRTPLLAGGRYRIVIRYVGKLNDDLEGFYRSSYETRDGQTKWLATTQFALAGARRAFPCWDTPEYKARFYITINHDETRGAISNMPPAEQNKNGQLVRVDFDGTLPMSTYLVAFVVSDFASLTNTAGDLTVWARQDIIKGGQFSNDIGERALQLLKEYTGIPYMLPKMDQAAIPDFAAGAMENWGLVTYREEALIEQDTQTIRIVELMTTTICHELGHQWAGNLVTLDWWSHTWLNEGLATYFESFICDQIKPEWHLRDKAVVGDYHFAMESDAIEDQHAMSSSVATANEGIAKFDEISYNKGGAVIRMWEHLLGIDVLKAGLRRFFSLHMFKNAKPEHLFKAIDFEAQKAGVLPAGVSFAEIARTWTEQPGVPVVTAIRDYNERELNLNQERFFYSPPNRALLVEQRWYIPVSVVEQSTVNWSSLKPSTWLSPSLDSRTMAVAKASSSQWILVNPKEIGYYRVNYDLKNWNLLARQLNNDLTAIPPASRAQLVNDALALARAKQLDYPIALQFLDFLTAEREVAPWQAALSALNYLRAKLAGTDAWTNFLTFLRKITAPAFASVGYSGSSDHEARLLRYYVVSYACYAGNSDCIASANDLLKAWLSNDGARLDADTKAVTLCFGLRGLDAEGNFEGLKAKWLAETDAATRSSLLAALACAQDDKLTGLLTDAINKKLDSVDQSEILSIWRATLNRPEQTHILFNFAKKNFKEIDSFFNSNAESVSVQLLSNCIGSITSSEQLTEARWWVESNFNGHSGYSSLQKAFLASYISLEWYRSSYEEVADWLVTALSP